MTAIPRSPQQTRAPRPARRPLLAKRRGQPRPSDDGVVRGVVRLDRRTKNLTARLKPGNIAVIDHADLDRVAAESLVEHGVSAVVNARPSITGRYPNLGPLVLVSANVPLLDDVGSDVFERLTEGDLATIEGDRLVVDGAIVAKGTLLDEETVKQRMDAAHADLSQVVERFAENTLEYVRREQKILLEGVRLPLKTNFNGRHALVVTRGYHYKEDLRHLRAYIRELRPVIVAVDGAADACLAEGLCPDVIVGDMDSISTEALACGAEIVVHPMGDWRRRYAEGDTDLGPPPNAATVEAMKLPYHICTAPGMSEDVAMLLAHDQGAELIVAVGSHTSMTEFLDKGREGMASTFLARLRLGPALVDAKGVSQLYRSRVRRRDLLLLVIAALFALVSVGVTSRPVGIYWDTAVQTAKTLWLRLQGLL